MYETPSDLPIGNEISEYFQRGDSFQTIVEEIAAIDHPVPAHFRFGNTFATVPEIREQFLKDLELSEYDFVISLLFGRALEQGFINRRKVVEVILQSRDGVVEAIHIPIRSAQEFLNNWCNDHRTIADDRFMEVVGRYKEEAQEVIPKQDTTWFILHPGTIPDAQPGEKRPKFTSHGLPVVTEACIMEMDEHFPDKTAWERYLREFTEQLTASNELGGNEYLVTFLYDLISLNAYRAYAGPIVRIIISTLAFLEQQVQYNIHHLRTVNPDLGYAGIPLISAESYGNITMLCHDPRQTRLEDILADTQAKFEEENPYLWTHAQTLIALSEAEHEGIRDRATYVLLAVMALLEHQAMSNRLAAIYGI